MTLAVVGRDELERRLDPDAARHAIGEALQRRPAAEPARQGLAFGCGELLVMPAESGALAGVKLATIAPDERPPEVPRAQGVYVLFDATTLAPLAVLDGAALTELRTAAVSAWAAERLADPEAGVLALFGAGPQARAHLRALAAVRPLEEVLLVTRDGRFAKDIGDVAAELGLHLRAARPDDVAAASMVCCCTTSAVPLFDGELLAPGTFVVAVGSHHPKQRELDTATIRRAAVVVETRRAALADAGDLLVPIESGDFTPEDIAADLFELAGMDEGGGPGLPAPAALAGRSTAARIAGRTADLVVFKSVGVAFEDLAVAAAAVPAASRSAAVAARLTPPPREGLGPSSHRTDASSAG